MRKLLLLLALATIVPCVIGCGPQLTEQEKNAPAPPGPHGGGPAPAGATGKTPDKP